MKENQAKKRRFICSDFGLRGHVIRTIFQTKCVTFIVARLLSLALLKKTLGEEEGRYIAKVMTILVIALRKTRVLHACNGAASDRVETRREVVEVRVRDTAAGKDPARKSSETERGEGASRLWSLCCCCPICDVLVSLAVTVCVVSPIAYRYYRICCSKLLIPGTDGQFVSRDNSPRSARWWILTVVTVSHSWHCTSLASQEHLHYSSGGWSPVWNYHDLKLILYVPESSPHFSECHFLKSRSV